MAGCGGHTGSRIIRIRRSLEKTVCTVSSVRDDGSRVRTLFAALTDGNDTSTLR
jgi:hypothetical protein